MTIEYKIKEAMAHFVERALGIKNVTVSSWEEDFYPGDPDATCEYCGADDTYSVSIYFTSPSTNRTLYTYDGSFGELIKELDSE